MKGLQLFPRWPLPFTHLWRGQEEAHLDRCLVLNRHLPPKGTCRRHKPAPSPSKACSTGRAWISSVQSCSESPGEGERRRTAHCLKEKPTPSPRHPPRPRTAASHGGPASCHRCYLSTDQLRKCGEAERGSLAANQTDASSLQLGNAGGRIAELLCSPPPHPARAPEKPHPVPARCPIAPASPASATQPNAAVPFAHVGQALPSPSASPPASRARRFLPPDAAGTGEGALPLPAAHSPARPSARRSTSPRAGSSRAGKRRAGWLTGYAAGFGGPVAAPASLAPQRTARSAFGVCRMGGWVRPHGSPTLGRGPAKEAAAALAFGELRPALVAASPPRVAEGDQARGGMSVPLAEPLQVDGPAPRAKGRPGVPKLASQSAFNREVG